ncbi:hypothetical protein [Arcticibacter sp. MXS-1]|uniref:hypothetical protein n=1 Tax=Arcticibacter sp. MXS-1 TaxID=3341726 RepID=UPI0035A8B591
MSCKLYGQEYHFTFQNDQSSVYNGILNRICIPIKCSEQNFNIKEVKSGLIKPDGTAKISSNWWTIPTASIDLAKPLEADGNGGFLIACARGLQVSVIGMERSLSLSAPFFIVEPGRIGITELESNGGGYQHILTAWKDEINPYGSSIAINLLSKSWFIYNSLSSGVEGLSLFVDADFQIDRPVKADGNTVSLRSKNSVLVLYATKQARSIVLYDDNIIWDSSLPGAKIPTVKPMALAMHNALFTVTPANGVALIGEYDKDLRHIFLGNLYVTFGLFNYLPTLPDPYAANLSALKTRLSSSAAGRSIVWVWLACHIAWSKSEKEHDSVGVSFFFAPLSQPFNVIREENETMETTEGAGGKQEFGEAIKQQSDGFYRQFYNMPLPAKTDDVMFAMSLQNRQTVVEDRLAFETFSLLDVSSKANQMGVAFTGTEQNKALLRTMGVSLAEDQQSGSAFPIQVSGLDIVTPGYNARAFTVPQIAWEPVFNLTPPGVSLDPPQGWNYFPNDGFATRIGNTSNLPVSLSPIPMAKYLEQMYRDKKDGKTYAVFNLPFGMLAMTVLDSGSGQSKKPKIRNVKPLFDQYIHGGIQLELTAGASFKEEDNLFQGLTIQLVNVLDMYGKPHNQSTLGGSVEDIFNREFSKAPANPQDNTRPAVPLTRIGLSGYGANTFSDWHNKNAAFAETSQATFKVVSGRTAHEVVQVKSVIYPWGIFVVRTITIVRLSNGYVARLDSGWQAESAGKFYFGVNNSSNPYEIHTGIVKGVYNVRNIRENELIHSDTMTIHTNDTIFNPATNKEEIYTGAPYTATARLRGLTFDADFEIEDVVEGAGANTYIPSKSVLGFVQLSPRGTPISKANFQTLLKSQNDSIGGTVNCTVRVAGSDQLMKVNRIDVNNAVDETNSPVFVAAARGAVVMPKDGSWTMVTHRRSDGTVAPLPPTMSAPLIRIGKWAKDGLANPKDALNLLRIAHPSELLRKPNNDTVNYGFLQNLNTQKVLYLTPSFKTGVNALLSKTPPLLADAYRLLNTKGVFPNIGNAEDNVGAAIQLLKGVDGAGNALQAFEAFADKTGNITDAGKQVLKILEIEMKTEAGKLMDQGYKLLKQHAKDALDQVFRFDLPDIEYELVKTEGLRIFIEYKASGKSGNFKGKLDYDVDSFAPKIADQWKGRMNNMAMVVDLGPFDRLMTIKGNFNAAKGTETNFGGNEAKDSNTLPHPEIEFSDALEPVIKILEILAQLSQGNYSDALKNGLKVAMSNNANIWEYKYEATKDIPLVRFPLGELYESPQTPLKLEASMSMGVYFNAALRVTTDPTQLLPTAGAFFKFHGGLQVMCATVGAGTIYAVGNVDLKLSADTSPKIALAMKFGFGAQIGVGLPVIGNVSVLFMVGVEIYADSSQTVIVTALMYFRGHAEILGGIVGVTITIEARGSVIKSGPEAPTNCKASVSFGLDINIFLVIDISFHESWEETRQIA